MLVSTEQLEQKNTVTDKIKRERKRKSGGVGVIVLEHNGKFTTRKRGNSQFA